MKFEWPRMWCWYWMLWLLDVRRATGGGIMFWLGVLVALLVGGVGIWMIASTSEDE